jgi:serine/threonine protein phosphatase PrpC
LQWTAHTSRGMVRSENEDSWTVQSFPDGLWLAMVADGMGGVNGGEVASSLAVKYCTEYVVNNRDEETPDELLRNAIAYGNSKVYEASSTSAGVQGMGTTLTAVLHRDGESRVYVGHVGDSRAYVISNGSIRQVTDDQSISGELVRNGTITEEDAMKHPGRNVLTAALGTQQSISVSLYPVDIVEGDVIVLCTDGLTSLVNSKEVLSMLHGSPKDQVASDLVTAANMRGGYDNVTVVILWPEVTASFGAGKRW